ncbi:MAG: GNAT family N-acetyltransferase [Candidatus Sungbacteria bacterium]|nr:GNAT family N-acetyltransferase [Candidatus Sungbacteria bacterium]
MKIVKKRFSDWDNNTKRKLKYATLPYGALRHFIRAFPDSPTIVLFDEERIMGWAFALPHGDEVSLSIFVHSRYRKKGVAKRLVVEALEDFLTIILFGWDLVSRNFSQKMQVLYPQRVIIKDWWKCHQQYVDMAEVAL